MTEDQWNNWTDPSLMLSFLRERASERKLRLFTCAYTRRLWSKLADERNEVGIMIAEQYADGQADEKDRESAWMEAREEVRRAIAEQDFERAGVVVYPMRCLEKSRDKLLPLAIDFLGERLDFHFHPWVPEDLGLIRDIFANPCCPVALCPSLLNSPAIPKLAQAVYDDRMMPAGTLDNSRLAALADLLEQAGCKTAELLEHLRSNGPKYRGSWSLDLVLGKE